MMQEKKLGDNTPRILKEAAAFTAITYPVYSGLRSMTSRENFIEVAKKAETFYMVAGFGAGKVLLDYGLLFFQ